LRRGLAAASSGINAARLITDFILGRLVLGFARRRRRGEVKLERRQQVGGEGENGT